MTSPGNGRQAGYRDGRDGPQRDRHGRVIPQALAGGFEYSDDSGRWVVRFWVDEMWAFRIDSRGEEVPHRSLSVSEAMDLMYSGGKRRREDRRVRHGNIGVSCHGAANCERSGDKNVSGPMDVEF